MKKPNAYQRIRAAMIKAEREVRAYARRHGRIEYSASLGLRWMKAVDRNEAKGLMQYSRRARGYIACTNG